MSPARRSLLAGVATSVTAALGGCFSWVGRGSTTTVDLEAVPRSQLVDETLVNASDDLDPAARSVLETGLPNGTSRFEDRPIENGTYVADGGTYYRVSVTNTGREPVEMPVLLANYSTDPTGDRVDRSALGPADRQTLGCAIASIDASGSGYCVVHAGNDSAFLTDSSPRSVTVEGGYAELTVERTGIQQTRWEYGFEPVASSWDGWNDRVARAEADLEFDDASLTAPQREILREAADGDAYVEERPVSAELERLESVIRRRTDGVPFPATVVFEGSFYELSIRKSSV